MSERQFLIQPLLQLLRDTLELSNSTIRVVEHRFEQIFVTVYGDPDVTFWDSEEFGGRHDGQRNFMIKNITKCIIDIDTSSAIGICFHGGGRKDGSYN